MRDGESFAVTWLKWAGEFGAAKGEGRGPKPTQEELIRGFLPLQPC